MNFSNASVIEDLVWSLRLADFPRSDNRARINDLLNGVPPYTDEQVRENRIDVNVNFLEGTKLAHDARRQFYNAFLKPGHFFTVTLDCGPIEKRLAWGHVITKEINKCLKRSLSYYDTQRATFANVVLHGIGPKVWTDDEIAIPRAIGVEDVLFPSQTLTSMENVEFFAVYRRYTAAQLHRLTSGPHVDPGWDMKTVKACITWAHAQGVQNLPSNDYYQPERIAELLKSDLGWFAADKVPTIDCWDFYHREDSGGVDGWSRKIVLDFQGGMGYGAIPVGNSTPRTNADTNILGSRNQFLYRSKKKVAAKMSEIIHFQFGDLSAVAPFRYHSVRGLGFLIFAVCHLQNRLRCRFNEALFEHMLQYFRVSNPDDVDRAEKINLINRGVIDNSVEFVKAADRWQVNQPLIESGLAHNREIMGSNAASFIQDYDFGKEQTEKTATQVMAEVNSASALVSAALQQAYSYAEWEYREICRRFCKKHSRDPMVKKFRAAVLRQGVPPEYIESDRWDVEAVRVLGAGNKTLEMVQAEGLMSIRSLLDPEAQREVTRDFVLGLTDDPSRMDRLVPETPTRVTDSVHDAQLAMGPLMQGLPVAIKSGINKLEYIPAMMASLLTAVQQVEQVQGGMAKPEQLIGFQNVIAHLGQQLQLLSQDESNKQQVKAFSDDLGNIANMVRAYGQRLQEAQQQQQQQNGQADPAELVRLQIEQAKGELKIQNMRESHAARTAERQTAFELQQQRDQDKHQAELQRAAEKAVIEDATTVMKAETASKNGEKKQDNG